MGDTIAKPVVAAGVSTATGGNPYHEAQARVIRQLSSPRQARGTSTLMLLTECRGRGAGLAVSLIMEVIGIRFNRMQPINEQWSERVLGNALVAISTAIKRDVLATNLALNCVVLLLQNGIAYGCTLGSARLCLSRDGNWYQLSENEVTQPLGSSPLIRSLPALRMEYGDNLLVCNHAIASGGFDCPASSVGFGKDLHPQVFCDELIDRAHSNTEQQALAAAMLSIRDSELGSMKFSRASV